ncbi:saccharopine dehydrogenase family protein [Maricurvus nonylphenolicus]|uniref:saccharopine dehydrogenase family protein n=1 Tax=Maricurvus nonylphenolicus TaxID=1008307 RepID=UPI0036F3181D
MKILALGGCGQQGRYAIKALLQHEVVSKIVIADIDIAKAQQFTSELNDLRVECLQLDVTDSSALINQMRLVDVVANFVGPFFRYAEAVVSAAIEAGINYVDICDDTKPTIELMDKYHEAAKAKGITILMGMGASPGMLNVFAKYAANNMDSVKDIRIFWNVSVNDIETDIVASLDNAAIFEHGLEIVSGDVPQFIDGKIQYVPAGSGMEEVEFPNLGKQKVYYVAHPEPVTLCRYIAAENITNQGGTLGMDDLLLGLRELGLTGDHSITVKGNSYKASDLGLSVMASIAEHSDPIPTSIAPEGSDSFVEVTGFKDGNPLQISISHKSNYALPRMDEGTGIAAAVGILMMGQGKIDIHGVHAPEGCVDPLQFFEGINAHGITVHERRVQVSQLN